MISISSSTSGETITEDFDLSPLDQTKPTEKFGTLKVDIRGFTETDDAVTISEAPSDEAYAATILALRENALSTTA